MDSYDTNVPTGEPPTAERGKPWLNVPGWPVASTGPDSIIMVNRLRIAGLQSVPSSVSWTYAASLKWLTTCIRHNG